MRRSLVPTIIAALVLAVAPALHATAAAAPATAPSGLHTVHVRLITGDTVTLVHRAHSRPTVAVNLRSHQGIAGQVTTFTKGRDIYVFPGAARRYLDAVLDPSLFDVTKLARQGSSNRVPVTVSFARGAKAHVPGLTVTTRGATSETGYLSARGSRAFGAALAQQWRADARAHRISRTLFGGVTRIAAPGATRVTRHFQQYTLVIHVIDPRGEPAGFAFISLTNVDNGLKFTNFFPAYNGLAKVSVPAGNYSGLAEYDAFLRRGVASYLMPVEEVPVTANNAQMTFDARTATTVPTVHTPRPAAMASETLEWDRDTARSFVSSSTSFGPGSRIHVAPSGPATQGQLHWVTTWQLQSAPATTPYTYDLTFDSDGAVPADQTYTLTAADLAQINSRYYTDQQARLAYFGRGESFPFQFFTITELLPLQTPTARTEYVNAPAGVRWSAMLIAAPSNRDPFQGAVMDNDRGYTPGSVSGAEWLRGPLAPGPQLPTPGSLYLCGYCRGSNVMALLFNPYIDTTPGHAGSLDALRRRPAVAAFALYRDGARILREWNSTGDLVHVPSGAGTYRAIVHTNRGLAGFATSTKAILNVKFQSSATSGVPAPHRWFCPTGRTCTVLPLLTATVPLPTDLEGTMPLGKSTFTFRVDHVTGAADSAITHVTFAVTVNQGHTYHQLPVTALGNHRYQVSITNPSVWANHGIGIRVHATDAAGGALTETVANAYYVAQS